MTFPKYQLVTGETHLDPATPLQPTKALEEPAPENSPPGGSWPGHFRSTRNVWAPYNSCSTAWPWLASDREVQVFSSHRTSHSKARRYGSHHIFKKHSGTPLLYSWQLQQPGKAAFPTLCSPVFTPQSVLPTAISLQTPLITLKLRFPSLHMHTMYSLYSAGDKEKGGRGPIPCQKMLIRLFQPAPFKMYCYGPINCTPRGDIPQINDYLRISHAAVQRHTAGFAGRITGAQMNTDDSSSQGRDPSFHFCWV